MDNTQDAYSTHGWLFFHWCCTVLYHCSNLHTYIHGLKNARFGHKHKLSLQWTKSQICFAWIIKYPKFWLQFCANFYFMILLMVRKVFISVVHRKPTNKTRFYNLPVARATSFENVKKKNQNLLKLLNFR